jgi:hypothetical protein
LEICNYDLIIMSLDQFLLSADTTDLNYPEIRPTLDLNFARVKALDPRITFTRASGGSYVGADGLIKYAGVNEPRFDHDPVTGESLGFLVEEARTNLTLYSGDFSQAHWSKISLSIFTANTIIAPDGTLTGSFIAFQNATSPLTGAQGLQPNTTISAGTNTLSCFAKIGTARYLALGLTNNGGETSTAIFDLQTGTVNGSGSHPNFTVNGTSISNAGAGWYRCSLTSTYAAGMAAHISSSTSGLSGVYGRDVSGDGTSGIYVWGAQVEAGAGPTSYIPTEGSSRTRAADTASITGKNFSSWYNSSEGTAFVDVIPKGISSGLPYQTYFSFSFNSDPSNRWGIIHQNASSIVILYVLGATGITLILDGTFSAGQKISIGMCQPNGTNVKYSIDGGSIKTVSVSTNPPITNLLLGGAISDNSELIGTLKRFTYYPKRLTDAQLQALTR